MALFGSGSKLVKEWISGRNPVLEVLRAERRHNFRLRLARGNQPNAKLELISRLARERKLPIEVVERSQLDLIDQGHQGVALETSAYPYVDIRDVFAFSKSQNEAPFFLLLDTIQDPQNLGTLLRSAEIMHVHGVILPIARTATITPSVVHASSGASEHLLIAQYNLAQAIKEIKAMDAWVIGLDESEQSKLLGELNLDMGIALVVGNEGEGLRDLVAKSCDHLMRLPMYGRIESLNAAVAGSIALYLARTARKV